MKLNITKISTPKVKHLPVAADKYKNPVGTWQVTTEGDCEGRSIKNLGVWSGHVAEIAFFLADKCYYSLRFESLAGTRTAGQKVPPVQTTKNHVWVSFAIESKTWDMTGEARAAWMAEFLDAKDQIEVVEKFNGCVFYASSCLILK